MATNKYSLGNALILVEKKSISAGEIYEMHWHDYIEIEVILEGCAEHIYNSDVYGIDSGSAYIVTHHDLHAFRAISDMELVNISFDISLLDETLINSLMYSAEKRLFCSFDKDKTKQIFALCDKLIEECPSKREHYELMCKSIASALVIEIIRSSPSQRYEATPVQKALEYIHLNFKSDISLSTLSGKLSVTPNYLGRIFTDKVGMTFNNYLNQIRLRYVCNMLLFSSLTVKEIAVMSGYSSVEYFFSVFKKQFGISPIEYRKTNTRRLARENVSTNSILI